MTALKGDFDRLATLVSDRRDELGLTYSQIADLNGPSRSTMSAIEHGARDSYQKRIVTRLERVMHWQAGSYQRILDGGDPVEAEPEPPQAPVRYADPALQHIAETPGLDEDTIKALIALTIGLSLADTAALRRA